MKTLGGRNLKQILQWLYSSTNLEVLKGFLNCRFDLIFLMLDPQDELYDRRLATHLVSLYHQTQEEEEEEYLVSLQNIPQGGRTRI